jgi:hypothetical protein
MFKKSINTTTGLLILLISAFLFVAKGQDNNVVLPVADPNGNPN